MVLNISSLEDMVNSIDLAILPQSIQDAITVTRMLDLRYLWVDALCILQDSSSNNEREMSRMENIYRSSYVTICAASARRCHEGFLKKRSRSGLWSSAYAPSKLSFPCPDGLAGSIPFRISPLRAENRTSE